MKSSRRMTKPEKQTDQPQRQEDPNTIAGRQSVNGVCMSGRRSNHNGNWAKFLKVLLYQRGSGIDTDSRAKFSGQQVFWAKVPARGFPIEGWAGTCTCCIWEVPRNDRKVFPPTSSIGILPGRYNNRGLINLRVSSQRSADKFRRGSAGR
jgi:hypothetical protein